MANLNPETTNLPDSVLSELQAIQPAYTARFSWGDFSVTPAAEQFYGYTPIIDVARGGLEQKINTVLERPRPEVTLTAPAELPFTREKESSTYYAHDQGNMGIWMAHADTPQEYAEDMVTLALDTLRAIPQLRNLNDKELLAKSTELGLSLADPTKLQSAAKESQLYDMLRFSSATISFQIASRREQALTSQAESAGEMRIRPKALVANQFGDDQFELLRTTEEVASYALRRLERIRDSIMSVYCRVSYDEVGRGLTQD